MDKRTRLLDLLKEYSYQTGDFTLASGKRSEFFIDCKQTLLLAQGHYLAAELILQEINKLSEDIQAVAGVELGACPLVSGVATLSALAGAKQSLNGLYVRKVVKDHGTKKLIEGYAPANTRIVLLEDTITTGGSSIKALEVLHEAGHHCLAVIAIVDRLEGGSQTIQSRFAIPVISLFTIQDFLN